MAGQRDPPEVDAERRGVLAQPAERGAALRHHLGDRSSGSQRVVDDGDGGPGLLEGRRDEAEVALVHGAPETAMEEDEERRRPPRPVEKIEPLRGLRPIGEIEATGPAATDGGARCRPAREIGAMLRNGGAQIVLGIKRGLVEAAIHNATLVLHRGAPKRSTWPRRSDSAPSRACARRLSAQAAIAAARSGIAPRDAPAMPSMTAATGGSGPAPPVAAAHRHLVSGGGE